VLQSTLSVSRSRATARAAAAVAITPAFTGSTARGVCYATPEIPLTVGVEVAEGVNRKTPDAKLR
jgi:hypothetical protein